MQDGLKQQFLEAYDAHADALYRHCYFRVFSRARAEELVQETYMKTWQYLKDGKVVKSMRPFLYRVLNNLIVDESRKKKEQSLDALLEESDAFDPPSNEHIRIEQAVMANEILSILDRIPEDYRKVLILRYVDDLDPKEIAELIGTTPNNVSVRINRAIQMVRAIVIKP